MTMNDIKAVEVFAGTSWESGLVKSLLENAEIEVFVQDEIQGNLVPWYTSPGGTSSIRLVVSSENEEKAREVVNQYMTDIARR
ncbi:hypothetical protein JCM18694_17720 [Prolixibacter denitrificans]|jgi:hypothetical protein|uniref:DUF2007 domain-containing protein n=2 Tax=Prolixibacter denitrificans TaxID=1541063 RepID=A0ABQ0ZJE8_9BACT|nr:hypothetical protein JCM18694_17720 [Prolixibacter denitrificans]